MSYILPSDLESGGVSNAQLIQLTDDAKTGEVDTDKVTKAIEDAEAEVNGYVGRRYTVPIAAPIPNLIQKLSTDIAAPEDLIEHEAEPELTPRGVLVDLISGEFLRRHDYL